jgi:hypothetical protein
MGTTQSLPLTHEKLFELTKDTRNLMNILLEYMLKELSVRDFLLLSNPEQCKKYILFFANNLHKYFYELQIVPTQTKDGIIAFRKSDDLTNPPGKKVDEERQGLCLILAYFYTRIFQIYGALALTLIDDLQTVSATGAMTVVTNQQKLMTPGRQQYYATAGVASSTYILSLGLFYFLDEYLTRNMEDEYFITKYTGSGDEKAKISFKNTDRTSSASQAGVFKIQSSDKLLGYLDIVVQPITGTSLRLFFDGIRYHKKSTTKLTPAEFPKTILSSKYITIETAANGSFRIVSYEGSIASFFNDLFKKLVLYLKEVTQYGESIVESGIAKELSYEKTYTALARDKPLGHCIARALQLLKQYPVSENQTIESNICKAKFLERTVTKEDGTQTKITRSGIPVPGASLDTSPGLSSLAQLFYEISFQKTPQLFTQPQIGILSLQEYKTFMENMATVYDDKGIDLSTPEKVKESTLQKLKNKRDQELCQKIGAKDQTVTVDRTVASQVQNYVRQLFQRQYEHAGKCGVILKQLFLIEKDKGTNRLKLSIHPRVLQRGLPELARINGEARRLLINYYSKCEEIYRDGMMKIVNSKTSSTTGVPLTRSKSDGVLQTIGSKPASSTIPTVLGPSGPLISPQAPALQFISRATPPAPSAPSAPSAPTALPVPSAPSAPSAPTALPVPSALPATSAPSALAAQTVPSSSSASPASRPFSRIPSFKLPPTKTKSTPIYGKGRSGKTQKQKKITP